MSARIYGPRAVPAPRPLDPAAVGDHIDRLYRAAWALCGTREDAEDLVQETYARVLAKPRLLTHDDDVGYLVQALRNTFRSQLRTASRRPRTEAFEQDAEPVDRRSATRPDEAVAAREVFDRIASLPEAFRDVLVAVDVAGLSYGETAALVGAKEATVTSRLYRARARVARDLAPGMDRGPAGVLERG